MFKSTQLVVAAMLLAGSAVAQAAVVTSLTITGGDFRMGSSPSVTCSSCITAGSTINTVDGLFEGPALTSGLIFELPITTFTAASAVGAAPSITGNPIQGSVSGSTITLDLGSFYMLTHGVNVLQAPTGNGIATGTWTPTGVGTGNFDITWASSSGSLFGPTSWHLTGTATTVVPIPAAAWLLGSGLLGLIGVARRKRR